MSPLTSALSEPIIATSERSLMVLSVIARHGKPIAVRQIKEITGLPLRAC